MDRRDLLSVITALIQSFFASVSDALCRLGSVTFLSKALSLWFACFSRLLIGWDSGYKLCCFDLNLDLALHV